MKNGRFMEKQMKRTVYEAPTTERIRIELESDFMTASVVKEDKTGVDADGHELLEVEMEKNSEWNDTGWE